MARIAALERPFPEHITPILEAMMPAGVEPIGLFRTFAHNPAMTESMLGWGGYELSRHLSLTMRDREIVIDRTTALCGAEYEWGVHVAFFAERVGLDAAQISSLVHGSSSDSCWTSNRDRLLIRTADALHASSDVDDALWNELHAELSDAEVLDLVMLCGWYHAISFAVRVTQVTLEDGAPRFADVAPPVVSPATVG